MLQNLEKSNSTALYPKILKDNLIFRVKFHKRCEDSYEAREAAAALFRNNPLPFFNLCLFTYDPRVPKADRPFITYPFQDKYITDVSNDITNGESSLTEKTRDMGVSWMILGEYLRRFLFLDEQFLVGSRKEDLVDEIGNISSLFERIRYMIRSMPGWIPEHCGFNKKNMPYLKIFKENGAAITGESTNPSFSRQGRYKAILLDEFAFVEHKDDAVWTSCGDSAPCKNVVSTVHGNHNKFARLRRSGKIKVYTLHWKQHPLKDEEWYEAECAKRTEVEIAQELDINYNVSAGKAFYRGFRRSLHFIKGIRPTPEKELLCGWDYGFQHPAFFVSQLDPFGRWIWLGLLLGENEQIEDFAEKATQYLNIKFPGYKIREAGDPAGNQQSDKSLFTSVQILNKSGFRPVSQPSNTAQTNYAARKNIIEKKLKTLINGLPSLIIADNEDTQILVEAMEGGYRYPDANKYGFIPDKPVRDGYYEHGMNAAEYVAVNFLQPINRKPKPKPKSNRPRSRDNI